MFNWYSLASSKLPQGKYKKFKTNIYHHFFLPNRLLASLSLLASICLVVFFLPSCGPRRFTYFL